ncbi:hypothetical protein LJ207_10730 [Halanaerobium sp. Z-7514]|uniref:Uncharacterized protein n=1 Tax=Halanaerobium polyolivorans TaxID=2886943 RepID=A0AAW4X232_9FIRM|nr:DUF6765 family protein [Halanaerobium polyolivorans]MCC3145799.1 hypothetical protein [Halanaerobium polyolivorans]
MQIDAHYYAVLALSRFIGFRKDIAHKISYASQFVDDARVNLVTLSDHNDPSLLKKLSETPPLFNAATAHSYFEVNTLSYAAMVNNTAAFHFVPGCEGESFVKKMRCKKESPIILDILKEAKNDDDPVKFGLTLHAYADTFTHQGFSGIISKVNDVDKDRAFNQVHLEYIYLIKNRMIKEFLIKIKDVFSKEKQDKFIPAYGHGQVYSYPDIPYLEWKYRFDASVDFSKKFEETRIHNVDRYKKAFMKIKINLEDFLENNPKFKDDNVSGEFNFEDFFEVLLNKDILEQRIEVWQEYLLDENLLSADDKKIIEYDEDLWLRDAFEDFISQDYKKRVVYDAYLADNFFETDWYNYYKGIHWYKNLFFKSAQKHGLAIPNK